MTKQNVIDIYALAYGGMGIGKIDGKIYFIEGALPGERVSFTLDNEKKRFIRGKVKDILTVSKHRAKPICPYYGKCGGCQYQHLKYEEELAAKAEQVRELLKRIGGLEEYNFAGITPSSFHYGYRSSITVHKAAKGYGYFSKDNQTIIPIDRCALAVEPINDTIRSFSDLDKKKDVTLKHDNAGNVWISGRSGHRFFKDNFLETDITSSPLAFSQVNRQVTLSMLEVLRAWAKEDKEDVLFDLYCGIGFFGILMRDMFKSVIGIDENSVAIDCAKATKKDLKSANLKFYLGNCDIDIPNYYERLCGKTNVIVIDPPRSGINKRLIEFLSSKKDFNRLFYVSCDPATLARDSKILIQDNKWKLDRIACFDMFPRTKYVESLAFFRR